MALTYSVDQVDSEGRELLTYGTPAFPIAFFDDDLVEVPIVWHWHEEFEIVVIIEGTVRVKIANSEFVLQKGDGYFSNSGILHTATLESEAGHQHCMVFAPEIIARREDLAWSSYVEPVLGHHELPFVKLSANVPWQNTILRLADEAWIAGAYEETDYPITVRANLGRIFSLIQSQKELLTHENIYTDKFQKDELRIKKALAYIDANYALPITTEDIAKSADISVSTCLRLFRTVLKTTPILYLMEYRIQKVTEKLKVSGETRTISEIAYTCGFADATYFNRCFKRMKGCTPTQFLKEARK